MSARLKRNYNWLKVIKGCKGKRLKEVMSVADKDLIYCICECIQNVLNSNVKLSQKQRAMLKKHGAVLRELASKKTAIKRKKKLLVQNGRNLNQT